MRFVPLMILMGLFAAFCVNSCLKRDRLLHDELIGKTEAYEQIRTGLAALAIKYKNQADLKAEVEKSWKAEKSQMLDKLKILSNAQISGANFARRTDHADLFGKTGYIFHELHFVEKDGKEGPPIGYVMLYADGRVVSKLYKHHFEVKSAISTDENTGRWRILNKADFVLEQAGLANRADSTKKNWQGVSYPLNIVGGEALIDPTEQQGAKKIFWLNPRVDIGVDAVMNATADARLAPNIGVSISSYGRTKRDSTFRFLRFGVGAVKKDEIYLTMTPVAYNFSELIPLFGNTYIYPAIGQSRRTGWNVGMGLAVEF